jgi:hypothetical protein
MLLWQKKSPKMQPNPYFIQFYTRIFLWVKSAENLINPSIFRKPTKIIKKPVRSGHPVDGHSVRR